MVHVVSSPLIHWSQCSANQCMTSSSKRREDQSRAAHFDEAAERKCWRKEDDVDKDEDEEDGKRQRRQRRRRRICSFIHRSCSSSYTNPSWCLHSLLTGKQGRKFFLSPDVKVLLLYALLNTVAPDAPYTNWAWFFFIPLWWTKTLFSKQQELFCSHSYQQLSYLQVNCNVFMFFYYGTK